MEGRTLSTSKFQNSNEGGDLASGSPEQALSPRTGGERPARGPSKARKIIWSGHAKALGPGMACGWRFGGCETALKHQ